MLPLIVVGWLAGVAFLLARLLVGWRRVKRLHALALLQPASRWAAAGERLARLVRLSRLPHMVDSALVDVPTVIGWLRPVVLLPMAAFANLTPAQIEAILAHELAHIRRHDYLVNVAQTVAETLLFYHPGVWWVSARVRAEREHCCDEIAVDICGDPTDYARALVELESWRVSSASMALAATGGPLLERVRRIMRLPATDGSRPVSWVVVIALVALFTAGARAVDWSQPDPAAPHVEQGLHLRAQVRSLHSAVGHLHNWLFWMVKYHVRALTGYRTERTLNAIGAPAMASNDRVRAFVGPDSLTRRAPGARSKPAPRTRRRSRRRRSSRRRRQSRQTRPPPEPPTPLHRSQSFHARLVFLCFAIPCAYGAEVRSSGVVELTRIRPIASLSGDGYLIWNAGRYSSPTPWKSGPSRAGSRTAILSPASGGRTNEARRMLADELRDLVRRTPLGRARAREILATRGVDGV